MLNKFCESTRRMPLLKPFMKIRVAKGIRETFPCRPINLLVFQYYIRKHMWQEAIIGQNIHCNLFSHKPWQKCGLSIFSMDKRMLDNASYKMQQLLSQNTLDPDHSCLQVFHFLSSACFKSVFSSNQTFIVSNIFIFIDGHCHGYQNVSQTRILL